MIGGVRWAAIFALVAVVLLGTVIASAQTAGQFAIPRFVIGTGGATGLSGGQFGLSATAGQPLAGRGGGGQFNLIAGFQLPSFSGTAGGKTVAIPVAVVRYQGGW